MKYHNISDSVLLLFYVMLWCIRKYLALKNLQKFGLSLGPPDKTFFLNQPQQMISPHRGDGFYSAWKDPQK